MPALWMIASKTPAALIRSASPRVLVIDERSPGSAAAAPGTPANACCARASSRACRTTSWPPRASCLAASRPSPSAEPVISTLDIRRAPSPARTYLALVSPPVALALDVFARSLAEIGSANDDDLEALGPGLVASPRTGRGAHRVPLLELDDLVVELHPPAPAEDHVHLLLLLVRVAVRKAIAGRDALVAQAGLLELERLSRQAELQVRRAVEPGPEVLQVLLEVPERERHGRNPTVPWPGSPIGCVKRRGARFLPGGARRSDSRYCFPCIARALVPGVSRLPFARGASVCRGLRQTQAWTKGKSRAGDVLACACTQTRESQHPPRDRSGRIRWRTLGP